MTHDQFNRLPVSVKCHFTPHAGCFLTAIEEVYYGIALYALRDFYVELWYHRQQQTIIKIRTFKEFRDNIPYLRKISLSGLLKDPADLDQEM